MKLHSLFNFLEKLVAPVSLSDEMCAKYGMHDNSGIIINACDEAEGVLFALDLTTDAFNEAGQIGCNVIVTHHPAIFNGVNRLGFGLSTRDALMAMCLQEGISVISMHLNFDCAPRGIDRFLMEGLGGENELAIMAQLTGGGYGRVYNVSPMPFGEYCSRVKRELNARNINFYGGETGIVRRVASFCGAGCDEQAIRFAIENGADTFVSADIKHHHIIELTQVANSVTPCGVRIIQPTHYASENYGFERISRLVAEKINIPVRYLTEVKYL